MDKDLIVSRSTMIATHAARVWEILTHPQYTRQYMMGCDVCSDWREGGSISWKGTHDGKTIDQKGEIISIVPGRELCYTMLDPRSGGSDDDKSYIHISYRLVPRNGVTELLTTLSNFRSDLSRAEDAARFWDFEVLPQIKILGERQPSPTYQQV